MLIYMKMDVKSIEWAGIIEEIVRIGLSFISAAKDVVRGTNSNSGDFGDEEASVLLVDGKSHTFQGK